MPMWKWIGNWARRLVNEMTDKAMERMVRDQYTENLFELIPVARKVGPIPLMETVMCGPIWDCHRPAR